MFSFTNTGKESALNHDWRMTEEGTKTDKIQQAMKNLKACRHNEEKGVINYPSPGPIIFLFHVCFCH
jgi:hypothetical protein